MNESLTRTFNYISQIHNLGKCERMFISKICEGDLTYLKEHRYNVDELMAFTYWKIAVDESANVYLLTFLCESFAIDIRMMFRGCTYLTLACMKNTNLDVIKYLCRHIEVSHSVEYTYQLRDWVTIKGDNCLMIACKYS